MNEYQDRVDIIDTVIDPSHIEAMSRLQTARDVTPPGTAMRAVGAPGTNMASIGAQVVPVRRDYAQVMRNIKIMAAMSGDRFFYRWDVKNRDGTTSTIIGATIKAANTIARSYGNCEVDCRAYDEGTHWTFYARFNDFESGFSLTRAFIQHKKQQTFNTQDAERKQQMAFALGQSKAIRNVILNALGDLGDFAVQEAMASLVNRIGRNLPGARDRLVEKLRSMKIDPARVERIVGRPIADMLAPDIARVVGSLSTISDGMASADDLFPDPAAVEQQQDQPQDTAAGGERSPPAAAKEPELPSPPADPVDPDFELPPGYDQPEGPDWDEWLLQMRGNIGDSASIEDLTMLLRANGPHLVALAKARPKESKELIGLGEKRRDELTAGGGK